MHSSATRAERVQGVLLDQFGVLHDGRVAYPAAIDAVQRMHAAGLRVYILSNSSRRASFALEKISALGFPRECFAGALCTLAAVSRHTAPRKAHVLAVQAAVRIDTSVFCIHVSF